jgi:pimeloyl-ACP methyl ester carboxylesterase
MGGIVAQKFALRYLHLLKGLVLVDTTSHGVGPEGTDDAFLANVDKRGYRKAVQDLSDISFSSSASPALLAWREKKSFKPRNS